MSENRTVWQIEHENSFVKAFILPQKRDRWIRLLGSKRRSAILRKLAGWSDFVPNCMWDLPTTPIEIIDVFYAQGIKPDRMTWVISNYDSLDMSQLPLSEALKKTVGMGQTVISVVAGTLAYYENETGYPFILQNRQQKNMNTQSKVL